MDELKHNLYVTTGDGEALIFVDGQVIDGYWEKDTRIDRTIFTDKKGQEIELNPGLTWISVLANDTNVAY